MTPDIWGPAPDTTCRHGLPPAALCLDCEGITPADPPPDLDPEGTDPDNPVPAPTDSPSQVVNIGGQHRSVPLGRRMARERLRGRYIFVTNLGWHRWDGTRWEPTDEDRMLVVAADWAQELIVGMVREGAPTEAINSALKYRDVGMVRQLLAGARTDEQLLVRADQLDAHEGILNCANGILNLSTGTLRPHDPAMLLTKTTGVNYQPSARHADWDKALAALPDSESAGWVQMHMGAAATGHTDHGSPIVFHQGTGANGKTTVIGAVRNSLGDYAVLLPDKLLAGRGDEHDTLWMPLRGARLAYLEELPEDHTLPIARVKKLADTSELTGRLIGRDYVSWPATHSIIVSTNYVPRVTETDHGTWRRLAMVSYPHTFRGPDKDPTLKRRLRGKSQQEAVLAWIVDGARAWYAAGCDLPPLPGAIADATREWRAAGDTIADFLANRVTFTDDHTDRLAMAELLEEFNTTGLTTGAKPWSMPLFSQRLKAHHVVADAGCTVDRGHRNRQPTALTRAVWTSSAQGAQGQSRGSRDTNSVRNLWTNPAHPAREHETADPPEPAIGPNHRFDGSRCSVHDEPVPCADCAAAEQGVAL